MGSGLVQNQLQRYDESCEQTTRKRTLNNVRSSNTSYFESSILLGLASEKEDEMSATRVVLCVGFGFLAVASRDLDIVWLFVTLLYSSHR